MLAAVTATLAATGVSAPAGAAAPAVAPRPAPAGAGPALTPDRAPRVDRPGPAVTTAGIGGAPSGEAWSPSVRKASPRAAAVRAVGVQPAPGVAAPGIGLQEWYPVELRQPADRLQLMVNTANGNVVVRYFDLRIGGAGFSTDLSHVYNNLAQGSGAFGRGWSMSTGRDVGLEVFSDRVVLHGPTGYTSTFTRNSDGSYRAGSGINATLTKGGTGEWTLRWNKSEDSWLFHPNGVLRQMQNNNGVNIKINYDAAKDDRVTAIYDPLGRVTTMSEYDAANRVVRMTDWTGGVHGPFSYDGTGNLTSFRDRLGKDISFGYDGAGNLTRITDPRGGVYTLAYDASRRVTSIAEPTGGSPAVTTFAYPAAGRTTETDPRGNTSTYHFDGQGRQTKAVDQLGHEQSQTWTANSDVASTTNGLGASITYGFDGQNNPTSAQLPTGARSVAGYTDAVHPYFPTSATDPQGNELRNVYDATGNLVSTRSVQLDRDVFRYEYNADGNVTKATDGDGRVTTYQYDMGGRLTVERPPSPRAERVISYDDHDRVIETYDGNRNKITYGYDALDRLVEIGRVDGETYTPLQYNNYDANGNLVGRYFGDVGVQFVHNPRNQVTEARNTRGTARYDVHYTYDENNNLTDIEDAGGRIKYTYDKANRLTFQSGPREGVHAIFEYDDADRRTRTRYDGGFAVRAGYDDSGRQTSLVGERSDGTKLIDRTYRWTDANGDTALLQSETREGTTLAYRYDARNRLLAQGSTGYTLDEASNLTAAEGRTFAINSAGQVGSSGGITYTHDGAGNLTAGSGGELTAAYSPTNQLTSLASRNSGTVSVDYDTVDQAQRAVVRTGGTEQVLTNTAIGVTGVVTGGARSVFVRDSAGGLVGQLTADGEMLYAVTDYQGSTLLLVEGTRQEEAARYTYTPYGTTTATGRAAAGNPFRWIGQWQFTDAHGTYALGHRQHDPHLARFTQPDPSGQEPNPYTYGLANPVTNTDPIGLYSSAQFGADIGEAVGGLGATIIFGAACGATAGIGCLLAGLFLGGMMGAIGGGGGAALGGGTPEEIRDSMISGAIGGAAGGGTGSLARRGIARINRN